MGESPSCPCSRLCSGLGRPPFEPARRQRLLELLGRTRVHAGQQQQRTLGLLVKCRVAARQVFGGREEVFRRRQVVATGALVLALPVGLG